MPAQVSVEEMAQYRETARRRLKAEQAQRMSCHAQGWELARQAADLLRREYGVERVSVFGSLLAPDRFSVTSDIDLAAWGLTSRNWLRAIVAVQDLSTDIEINLVDVECCSPEFRAVIEREGAPL